MEKKTPVPTDKEKARAKEKEKAAPAPKRGLIFQPGAGTNQDVWTR